MEEHSRLCSCLDEAIEDELGLDAYLTQLGEFVERHVQSMLDQSVADGLRVDDIEDMGTLATYIRSAAALQPDSTADPARRCQVHPSPTPPDFCEAVNACLEILSKHRRCCLLPSW